MKFSYRFSNLCGTVYKCGNICFSADGNVLYSPVGNRVSVFDLVNHSSYTLPFETHKNIARLCVSHNGRFMIAVDVDGKAMFVNIKKRIALYRFSFESPVNDINFSPDDKLIAVAMEKKIQLWYTPTEERHFAPLEKFIEFAQHFDTVTSVQWSHNGDYLVTSCADMNIRIFSVGHIEGFLSITLTGHHAPTLGAYFASDDMSIISVSEDGGIFVWKWTEIDDEDWNSYVRFQKRHHRKRNAPSKDINNEEEEEKNEEENEEEAENRSIYYHGRWVIDHRYFNPDTTVQVLITSCSFNAATNMLIVGLNSGVFYLYEMPDFSLIHSLSISRNDITSCCINATGDWLAFGCSTLGQLLVWEWQSETYVLKQQGHYYNVSTLEFSPDGSVIASGGDDGKVKLWSVNSGFCFVTFNEHTAGITDICYVKGGHAILSASLDGTVRAFDLIRYRNFRTLTTPTPVQFTCVTCDASGDLVAAGTNSPFTIYIWSLRTGKLLDTLTGHEGPISCLKFNNRGTVLASGSWDHTVRTWDLLGSGLKESLSHPAEIVSLDWRRDGEELIAACMNGSIYIWEPKDAVVKGTIDGRRDLRGGRKSTDVFTAEHNMEGRYFKSVCYSADGDFVLAAGMSKYVCIYDIKSKVVVRKYPLSQNLSLEGILDKLNSKFMTEVGAISELPEDEYKNNHIESLHRKDQEFIAPGVLKGDGAKRTTKEEMYCNCVKFSPTGDSWAVASSQGLIIYSLDPTLSFDPFDLKEEVTPTSIKYALAGEEWNKALVYSLHLNEEELIKKVLQSIPFSQIQPTCAVVPRLFLARLFQVLCSQVTATAYIEYYITWIVWLLKIHGEYIRTNLRKYLPVLRAIQKCLIEHYNLCKNTSDMNLYSLQYLSEICGNTKSMEIVEEEIEKKEETEDYGDFEVDEAMTHF